jgi:type IV secretory pathway VirJ component
MVKIARHESVMALRLRLLSFALAAGLVFAGASKASNLFEPADTPATAPGDTLAVLYSGDGGWGALDRGVAKQLASDGMPVIGVNSLHYFLNRRTPQQAAADLAAALRSHEARWGQRKVVLIGYSFGADALPAIVPMLPEDLRAQIKSLVLIGVGPTGDLQFHPASWLNRAAPGSYPVVPAIQALKGLPMTCIYGDKEHHDVCSALPDATIHKVQLTGGHHFGGDYGKLGQAIYEAARL